MSRNNRAKKLAAELNIPYATALRRVRANGIDTGPLEALLSAGTSQISTGIPGLDAFTGGLSAGKLVTFAGISSSGLSVALLTIAEQVAVHQRINTLWVDMESSAEMVTERLISGIAQVNRPWFRSSELTDAETGRVRSAEELLSRSPLTIRGSGEDRIFTVDDLEQALQQQPAPPRVLIIDGVRLLDDYPDGAYHEHLAELAERLKRLAMRLKIAICVTQPMASLPLRDPMSSPDLYPFAALSDQVIVLHTHPPHSEQPPRMQLVKSRMSAIGWFRVTPRFEFARFEPHPDPTESQ